MADRGVPVDEGWAWFIVLGYFISNFCMVGIAKSFGILLLEFVGHFKVTVAMAASVMGVAGAIYTLTAPIFVAGGQHFTQRKVVIFGGIVGAFGLAMSSLLFSIEYVILTFGALYGLGNACLFGNGLVMLGMYFKKMRSLANGLALSGSSIGQFVIPPLLQFLLDTYSLRGTLLIIGGVYLHAIICGCLYRPPSFYTQHKTVNQSAEAKSLLDKEPVQQADTQTGTELVAITAKRSKEEKDMSDMNQKTLNENNAYTNSIDKVSSAEVNTHNQSVSNMAEQASGSSGRNSCQECSAFLSGLIDLRVLKSLIVLLYTVVSFLLFFGYFNFILFMPAAALARNITKYEKALLVSITGICDLCGRILIGVAGDFTSIDRYKLLATSTTLCGLSIFSFNFANVYWLMCVCVGLYGFFGGCYVSINAPVIIDFVGMTAMPKVLGVILFIQGLGAAVGQPALGGVRDRLGSYQVVTYICSAMMLCGSALLFLYPIVKRMEDQRLAKISKSDNYELEVTVET